MRHELKALLTQHEGKVPHAYQDHLGFWTIGVGRLIDERRGGGLSDAEIDYLLDNDIDHVLSQLEPSIRDWYGLPDRVKLALACMAFQMGVAGLFGFSRMLGHIEQKDWTQAASEALKSKWAQQTPSRAEYIAELIRGAA